MKKNVQPVCVVTWLCWFTRRWESIKGIPLCKQLTRPKTDCSLFVCRLATRTDGRKLVLSSAQGHISTKHNTEEL